LLTILQFLGLCHAGRNSCHATS